MEHLTAAVEALNATVSELSKRLDVQEEIAKQLDENRSGLHTVRMVVGVLGILLVMNLGLVTGFGLLYHQVDRNQHELQAVQQRTSAEILCPLYQVFALSIKTNPPPPNYNAEQLELRQHAADTILAGLAKLGCA